MHPLARTLLTCAVITVAAATGGAGAATFTVNSTADTTDGTCGAAPGGCTLHEAIEAAVATPGRDTIAFDPAVFPPGAPAVIDLFQITPVIADPAGTVLDGAGAGVVIAAANQQGPSADPLVFASAPGVPLANVRVANVTVRGFLGSGIVICGGEYPACDQDVAKPVVENVVGSNGVSAIRIAGRTIAKARIAGSVATENGGHGIEVAASESLTDTRIEGCTARHNGGAGIRLGAAAAAAGTVVTDSIVALNDGVGIDIESAGTLSKTKLTGLTVVANQAFGMILRATGDQSATTIAQTVSTGNLAGLVLDADHLLATTLKGVAANGNGQSGIVLGAFKAVAKVTITNATAARNQMHGISVHSDGPVSGVRVSRSVVTTNGGIGLDLVGSQNVVKSVHADANGAGIQLGAPGGGNTIEKCTASANNGPPSGAGIAVATGSTGNVIRKNLAYLNDGPDLDDGNPGCDGNTWTKNLFSGVSVACIH